MAAHRKTLRRTIEYLGSINQRASLSPQDKAALKRYFLRFVAVPRAERLKR